MNSCNTSLKVKWNQKKNMPQVSINLWASILMRFLLNFLLHDTDFDLDYTNLIILRCHQHIRLINFLQISQFYFYKSSCLLQNDSLVHCQVTELSIFSSLHKIEICHCICLEADLYLHITHHFFHHKCRWKTDKQTAYRKNAEVQAHQELLFPQWLHDRHSIF